MFWSFSFWFISIENSWQWNHSSVPHYTIYHRDLWSVHFRVSPESTAENIILLMEYLLEISLFLPTRCKFSIYSPIILETMTSNTFDAASYSVAMPYGYDHDNDKSMPIAVVGIGFRGPGDATNAERLWQMILDGREARTPIPQSRWNNGSFYHPDHSRHGAVRLN